ncbi:DUF4344 domain-containing metallopeptidase [Curvibacter sp. RS43]|uniref:DUF4344 domain-containing metallopeptidase n=1 Tax=Curvibacter microcysteis TaxID=3026419 RepID=UPI00235ECCC9|nr:DUF4344 domain-containing metallopeptidase [Curvibacter sp. RS43]MDD0812974.1 DUF4344 domain-containing metallopeptidase [Curvibacter sp. RS43]
MRSLLIAVAIAAGSVVQAATPIQMLLDKGKAIPAYQETSVQGQQMYLAALQRARMAERMAQLINSTFLLKQDVTVVIRSCGVVNAFFQPGTNEISICTEMVEMIGRLASEDADFMNQNSREQFALKIEGLLWSIFLHELGHALVHVNKVPITGREEDVADQFVVWYGAHFVDFNKAALFIPTVWYWSRMSKLSDLPSMSPDQRRAYLANEHSLDGVRVFNVACWAFGTGLAEGIESARAVQLPRERMLRCPNEWEKADASMRTLFKKYVKVAPFRGPW